MERKYTNQAEALEVAKEAMWLAYQASGVVGMGVFQARDSVTKEQLIGDYGLDADYAYGRMMKTYLTVKDNTLSCNDTPRSDYQSWARKYPTYAALIDAAEKAVITQLA